jgi:hypothetical protein
MKIIWGGFIGFIIGILALLIIWFAFPVSGFMPIPNAIIYFVDIFRSIPIIDSPIEIHFPGVRGEDIRIFFAHLIIVAIGVLLGIVSSAIISCIEKNAGPQANNENKDAK